MCDITYYAEVGQFFSSDNYIFTRNYQPPHGGLLSSSCGGPKVDFAGRSEERTTGLRELDTIVSIRHILGIHTDLIDVNTKSGILLWC